MNEAPTSEKIIGLFATFRENEAEIERMDAQLKQKNAANEKVQRDLDLVSKNVAHLEIEQDRLRRAHVKVKEAIKTLEPQLAKEKEAQYAIYMDLVQTEEATAKMEEEHVTKELAAARELRDTTQRYFDQRKTFADSILMDLEKKKE